MDVTNTLHVGTILMGLIGGLALFLYGMEQMTQALKTVAGSGMKTLLARLTTNRFKAAFAGAFVTAIIQSSSVTTVLVVGFITAGLMSLSQSVGIIMGANIGTTVTAQIIAFKITKYALVMIASGFAMLFFVKDKNIRQYGQMLLGLGLVFFGMELMSNATSPLRSYQPFIDLMQHMDNPLTGILIGLAFTALVQSSSATTGVIIVLASQGFITLEAGIALAFGANIGTCVTALLAAIGKPTEAIRASFIHVIFNVAGVVTWFGLIEQLADLVRWLSPVASNLEGTAKLAAETPRQIANAHTIFNVANTLVFIWFTEPFANLANRIIPASKKKGKSDEHPLFLDNILLQTPDLAFDIVRMEIGRLGSHALHMVSSALHPLLQGTHTELDELQKMDDVVDRLHGALITYLGRLSLENLSEVQSQQLYDYMAAANYLENIGDMIETNFVETGRQRLEQDFQISDATAEILASLHDKVCWSVEQSIESLVAADKALAFEVQDAKDEINQLADETERHLANRLSANEPHRLNAFLLETEVLEYLKRTYYFAKRIAKLVAEEEMSYIKPATSEKENRKKPNWYYNQSGVIPYRQRNDEIEIMLITSRGRKHWIIPKGVIAQHSLPHESAANEAFEEGGVKGTIDLTPLSTYQYKKWGGICTVQVFPLAVEEELDQWPEFRMRKRQWVSLPQAIEIVDEPGLKQVLEQAKNWFKSDVNLLK